MPRIHQVFTRGWSRHYGKGRLHAALLGPADSELDWKTPQQRAGKEFSRLFFLLCRGSVSSRRCCREMIPEGAQQQQPEEAAVELTWWGAPLQRGDGGQTHCSCPAELGLGSCVCRWTRTRFRQAAELVSAEQQIWQPNLQGGEDLLIDLIAISPVGPI